MVEFSKYLLHLDYLRRISNLGIESFVEGICSPRQYHRYLNGTSHIPYDTFSKLCKRLDLSVNEFNFSFQSLGNSEFDDVRVFYSALCNRDKTKSEQSFNKLKNHNFNNDEAMRFFQFCETFYNQLYGYITKFTAFDRYVKLINYKNFEEKSIYTFMDGLCLIEIASLEMELGKTDAITYLHEMLSDRKSRYVSSNTRYVLPQLYVRISKMYGINNQLDKSLEIAKEGVIYSLSINDMSTLEFLYYFIFLCNLKLKNLDEAKIYKQKCLSICDIKERPDLQTKYKNLIASDLLKANINI